MKKIIFIFSLVALFSGCSRRIGPTESEKQAQGVRNAIVACEIELSIDSTAQAVVSVEGLADSISIYAVCEGGRIDEIISGIAAWVSSGNTLIIQGKIPPKIFRQEVCRLLITLTGKSCQITFLPSSTVWYEGEEISPIFIDGEI